jgi:hypothetical protein
MESPAELTPCLERLAFASCMRARAINVRRLFHGLALGAAILARRRHARTNGVGTLLDFRGGHFVSPGLGSQAANLGTT